MLNLDTTNETTLVCGLCLFMLPTDRRSYYCSRRRRHLLGDGGGGGTMGGGRGERWGKVLTVPSVCDDAVKKHADAAVRKQKSNKCGEVTLPSVVV